MLGQLSNCVFLKIIFDLIENNGEDDELVLTSIKFILSLNLRFEYSHENPIMLTLLAVNEQLSCRELVERLILLFNRSGKTKKNNFFLTILFVSNWMQNNKFSHKIFQGFIRWSSNDKWCVIIWFRSTFNCGNN